MSDAEGEASIPSQPNAPTQASAAFEEDPALYESGDEEEAPPVKKFRQKSRDYRVIQIFDDKEGFDLWWQTEKDKWRAAERHATKGCDTDYFRCKYGKRINYNCSKMLRVDFSAENTSVMVGETAGEHEHTPIEKNALSEETKRTIVELSSTGLPPLRILNVLRNRNIDPLPSLLQVQNLVKRSKDDGGSSSKFTVHDLKQYCEDASVVAEPGDGPDTPFVLRYHIESATKFCIVWSTKKLLDAQLQSKLLQVDSTCKTNWNGFPVQVSGYSDVNHRFQATMLALSHSEDTWSYSKIMQAVKVRGYSPEVVLGDGAKEITAAVKNVFPDALRAMYWAHVIRQVDKRLSGFDKALKNKLRDDLKLLQYARSQREFELMARSLFESWPEEAHDFAEYVRKQWIDSPVCFWFEGAHRYPSTNNGLESGNKQIKDSHTLRRLLPLPQFLKVATEITKGWSTSLPEQVAEKPTVKPHVFREAYLLSKSGRTWRKTQGQERYIIASEDAKVKSSEELATALDECVADFESFEQFAKNRFKVYVVERAPCGRYLICSCPIGSKKKACKHSTMVSCLPAVGLEAYPPDASAEYLGQKKKSGRPSQKPGRPQLAEVNNRRAVAN